MRYFLSLIFFSISLFAFNYHLKAYKISEGVHCFFGLPSQVSYVNGGNMINSCYIETLDGYVVIDSGPTYAYAQEAYEIMEKKKKIPVKYVINTSWEEVHVLGNEFYRERGATLIGPFGHKRHHETNETLELTVKLSKDVMLNTRVVPLDIYLKEDKVLELDKIKFEIKTLKENDDYLYIYVKDKQIVFAGDIIFNNRVLPIDKGRSITHWLKSIEELSSLNWVDIISSHGYMTRRSALKRTQKYLNLLKEEVLTRIMRGESKVEIISNVKLSSFLEDRFYALLHLKNVENVYDELYKKIFEEISTVKTLPESKLDSSKIIEAKLKPKIMPKKIKVPTVPAVRYKSFLTALKQGKSKKKIVFIKVRSSICKYCDQLERVISKNPKVRKILNKYFEVVEINTDYETLPMELTVRSTPTLIFIRPDSEQVLMQLAGIRALGELLDILNEAVKDGHNNGYLK